MLSRHSIRYVLAGFAMVLLGLVSACTADVTVPPPEPNPQYCTREYQPVCARRGGDRRTFSNACMAESSGYRVLGYGECRREPEEQRFCSREYRPVCAVRNQRVRDFGNACEAEAAGYRVVGEGPC